MPHVLIICHCPSPAVDALCAAAAAGADAAADPPLRVEVRSPFDVDAAAVKASRGLILGTTENFGYMSGALKDFFDRIYTECLDATPALPYGLFVKGGQDGTCARDSVVRIVTGLRWRAIAPPLVMAGSIRSQWKDDCRELGMTLTAGLAAGLF